MRCTEVDPNVRARHAFFLALPWLLLTSCDSSAEGDADAAQVAQVSTGTGAGPVTASASAGPTSTTASGSHTVNTTTGAPPSNTTATSGGQVSSTTGGDGFGGASTGDTTTATGGGTGGATLTGSMSAGGTQGAGGTTASVTPAVLVFSRTLGYRHASIPVAVDALDDLAQTEGWQFAATEEASVFSDDGLSPYNVLVMLSPTGDILDAEQQGAFERYIRAGNGYVGIHAASDTEFDWPWYGELVGAYFNVHPDIQEATLLVEDTTHPSTAHLPQTWTRTDEWYGFVTNPRSDVSVLISIDEDSYSPGESEMDGDHPIAWYHEFDGGRSFYTALGHTSESYGEPEFMAHLKGAIEWAAGASE